MRLEHKLLVAFRNRWQSAKDIEVKEVRRLSIEQKLQQLVSLIHMARGLGVDFQEDEETLEVRDRWIFLKNKYITKH